MDQDLTFNARKSKIVTNIEGRKDRLELRGEMVETGQAYTITLDEEEEYKYLGVTVRVSGGIFKTAWDNKIKKKRQNGWQMQCTMTVEYLPKNTGERWKP